MGEKLAVVDENDRVIGSDEREQVHGSDMWHRHVQIFIFNSKGEMLVQLRSPDKDRYPNTLEGSVTEHVRAGENYEEAARRGLMEELGIEADLRELLHFRAEYSTDERMVCKLFEGQHDGSFRLSSETVEIRFMDEDQLRELLEKRAHLMAPWFIESLRWKLGLPNKLKEIG